MTLLFLHLQLLQIIFHYRRCTTFLPNQQVSSYISIDLVFLISSNFFQFLATVSTFFHSVPHYFAAIPTSFVYIFLFPISFVSNIDLTLFSSLLITCSSSHLSCSYSMVSSMVFIFNLSLNSCFLILFCFFFYFIQKSRMYTC